jgi:hypothetical protein
MSFRALWDSYALNAISRALLAVAVLVISDGCTRKHYRLSADKDARKLSRQLSMSPDWAWCDLSPYPDPRSRFFDPFNRDYPPKPPDDPSAQRVMERIFGPHGMQKWAKYGNTDEITNPMWETLLPTYARVTPAPDCKVILDLPTANLLGTIHCRDVWTNTEEVYLSALDVAFERFRFQVQYFGGNLTTMTTSGNEAEGILGRIEQGPRTSSNSVLDTESYFGFSRQFATGAQITASIANSMVWKFSGEGQSFATSVINWSFIQPMLRGGGKIVILETLTRAERNLLGNLRAMAQFRQDLFREIAIGGNTTIEPNRVGGFQGGAGLTGFSGIGAGGFGGVGAGQGFAVATGSAATIGGSGAGGTAGLAGGGEGILSGYYGLIQRLQTIRNTEVLLSSEELTLGLLESNFEAGLIDLVQVDEFRQNIETERANLLRARAAMQDSIENYLISALSLPPTLPIELDDAPIKQFQLISPEINALQKEATEIMAEIGALPEKPTFEQVTAVARGMVELVENSRDDFATVVQDYEGLLAERDRLLALKESDEQREEFKEAVQTVGDNLKILGTRFEKVAQDINSLHQDLQPGREADATADLIELITELSGTVQEIGLIQAATRVQKVTIKPVRLSYDVAVEIARANRMDWMNQRMSLVDQWRLVAFNANRLLAVLNIQIDGNTGTVGNNPVRFRGSTTNMQGSINFQAPLNRKAERNLYRESLIDYQRAKRSYSLYVDRTVFNIRSNIRQLERLEQNLEIQRRALAIAIRRVDKTLEDLNQPSPPVQPGQAPPQLGPTLSQNLLRALSDLRNIQDNFMSVWLNHEASRITLLFQLGLLESQPDGSFAEVPLDDASYIGSFEQLVPPESCTPGISYLDEVDKAIAKGDGVDNVLAKNPEDELIKTVETTTGEKISEADIAAREESQKIEENEKAEAEKTENRLNRVRHLPFVSAALQSMGVDPGPEILPKEDYPRTLREFRSMKEAGMSNEEIARKTGWELPSIEALHEAAEMSKLPIVDSMPTKSYRDELPTNEEAGIIPPPDTPGWKDPPQLMKGSQGPNIPIPAAPAPPSDKSVWKRALPALSKEESKFESLTGSTSG